MMKTQNATQYMSCPRECGIDVREHNSSGLYGGKCDTDSNPARPMTRDELADWFAIRGVSRRDLGALVDEYEGNSLNEMDEMYEALHGPIA